ncbi:MULTISPECIES: zinc ribbon domain-containing protein [Natrialba]|uniref:Zinc ribbon domain-containing protein n=1 Tax=Natrialba swarupiae TaxID=2448032 RepID=A0A5D5AM78_9EURY|nr:MULTISPECIES: zinc ribbon domain-containing protein [Natrialba]MCW8173054.1 zinc ribbon domain-containing protein [Natrialba swarupiae]MWV40850.1 zinc ribbon domain-containing protein [Natrialba sp. INN-245]TYT60570.1 zinc ribbon domain-containing protein [Natrialba swarupiae]
MTWLRALAAAGLSVLMPGAGHALIRDWLRTLVFAGLYLSAIVIFLPSIEQITAIESVGEGMELVGDEIDTMGQFVLSFIVLFAAIDATFRAMGFPPGSSNESVDGPSCPECGKELDEDLTFCHWCTTRLEPVEPEEEDSNAAGETGSEAEPVEAKR